MYWLFMDYQTLIVPGLKGSGPTHWQSWMQRQIHGAIRVEQEDWGTPTILSWARNVHKAIDAADRRVILVAHSFGVLASVVGAASLADKVAGALYVAPADPSRFTLAGEHLSEDRLQIESGLYNHIPKVSLGYPSTLVASLDDPFISFKRSANWATRWHSKLVSIGHAGHINVNSGFGPWPKGLDLYREVVSRDISVEALPTQYNYLAG